MIDDSIRLVNRIARRILNDLIYTSNIEYIQHLAEDTEIVSSDKLIEFVWDYVDEYVVDDIIDSLTKEIKNNISEDDCKLLLESMVNDISGLYDNNGTYADALVNYYVYLSDDDKDPYNFIHFKYGEYLFKKMCDIFGY